MALPNLSNVDLESLLEMGWAKVIADLCVDETAPEGQQRTLTCRTADGLNSMLFTLNHADTDKLYGCGRVKTGDIVLRSYRDEAGEILTLARRRNGLGQAMDATDAAEPSTPLERLATIGIADTMGRTAELLAQETAILDQVVDDVRPVNHGTPGYGGDGGAVRVVLTSAKRMTGEELAALSRMPTDGELWELRKQAHEEHRLALDAIRDAAFPDRQPTPGLATTGEQAMQANSTRPSLSGGGMKTLGETVTERPTLMSISHRMADVTETAKHLLTSMVDMNDRLGGPRPSEDAANGARSGGQGSYLEAMDGFVTETMRALRDAHNEIIRLRDIVGT